ncbi:MAG: heat-inducible transcription repressor HrcA [Proteobacteria bacterium]|nr:heat-inducible transcription repressor HrcA [Pseudomonadota bacterium]
MSRIAKPKQSLTQRHQMLLFATIAEYVSTGRPVSSRSLAKKHQMGLSPATIRRELQWLTDQDFLVQPHTSAGRVPTDRAFRLFADTLKAETQQIDNDKREKLINGLSGLFPGEPRSWQDIVRLLSDLSYQAALIVTPALSDAVLRLLKFVPCGSGSLLAVIVTREGLVHNAYIQSPDPFNERDLERIHNYLGELVEGRTLNEVRRVLRKELEDSRRSCDALREQATMLGTKAIQASVNRASELVVEGRSHLIAQPDLTDRIEELMRVLEEKARILDLLDSAAETSRGPVVIIGEEGGEGFDGCAMITSPFGEKNNEGQIGIIGSMRMDYSAVIPLVALAAQFLSTHLLGNDD